MRQLVRIRSQVGNEISQLVKPVFYPLQTASLLGHQNGENYDVKRMAKNFHIFNNAGKGKIRIIGHISFWENASDDFTRKIDQLINDGVLDVEVYINSPGGQMEHANEIINQLHRFKGNKVVTLGAMCCSAAFTIALSFETENASCYTNTMGMYHDPAGLIRVSKMSDFDSNKKLYEDMRNDVVDRISKKTGLSKEEVSSNMEKTTWLNAKELKAQGIISNIIDSKDKVPTGAKNALQNMGFDIPPFLNDLEESDSPFVSNMDESEIDQVMEVFRKAKADIQKAIDKDTNQKSNHNETEMKELAKKLGLPENATADQIATAIEALQNKAKFAEEALVNIAVAKGIKKENAEKSVKNNFEGTMELVNGIESPSSQSDGDDEDEEGEGEGKTKKPTNARPSGILDALRNELGLGEGNSPKNKKLEDYSPEELDALEKENPEKFEQLFNASSLGKVKNPQD